MKFRKEKEIKDEAREHEIKERMMSRLRKRTPRTSNTNPKKQRLSDEPTASNSIERDPIHNSPTTNEQPPSTPLQEDNFNQEVQSQQSNDDEVQSQQSNDDEVQSQQSII